VRRRRGTPAGTGAPSLVRAAPVKASIALLAVAAAIGPLSAAWVERVYSRGFYPWLQAHLTRATNHTPWALFDLAGAAVLAGLAVWWGVRLRHAPHHRLGRTVIGLTIDTTVVGAFLYLLFLIAWGLNYRREPLQSTLDFRDDRITRDARRALAWRTVAELNRLHAETAQAAWPALPDVPALLRPGFERAARQLGVNWNVSPGVPKRSLLNAYFTRAAVDGMTDPFFLEILINQGLLPFERPFVVAHEWGHLAGFADESEANFAGWLTCMQGSALTRYSGWVSLYGIVVSALPDAERTTVAAALDQGPRRDLRAVADRILTQSVPIARRAGNAVYDRFLKANRVDAGIASYGGVVRLILGTRFVSGDVPALRRSPGTGERRQEPQPHGRGDDWAFQSRE
jgi:hypothetical protein